MKPVASVGSTAEDDSGVETTYVRTPGAAAEITTDGASCVSAEGEPRPVSFTAADQAGRAVFSFSQWDEPASLPELDC